MERQEVLDNLKTMFKVLLNSQANNVDIDIYLKKPYLFSTENLSYLRSFKDNLSKDKNILTVLGSGDQVLASTIFGAVNFTTFDYNELQYPVYELKKAAALNLNVSQYNNFLLKTGNKKFFSPIIFNTLKKDLPAGLDEYWQTIISNINLSNEEDIAALFKAGIHICKDNLKKEFLPYIRTNKDYYNLNDNLEKIKLKHYKSTLIDLKNTLTDETFDFINLSNILDNVCYVSDESNEEIGNNIDVIKNVLYERLNPDGVIILDYVFGNSKNDLKENNIENKKPSNYNEKAKEIFNRRNRKLYNMLNDKFEINTLELPTTGLYNVKCGNRDTVIYTKKK